MGSGHVCVLIRKYMHSLVVLVLRSFCGVVAGITSSQSLRY